MDGKAETERADTEMVEPQTPRDNRRLRDPPAALRRQRWGSLWTVRGKRGHLPSSGRPARLLLRVWEQAEAAPPSEDLPPAPLLLPLPPCLVPPGSGQQRGGKPGSAPGGGGSGWRSCCSSRLPWPPQGRLWLAVSQGGAEPVPLLLSGVPCPGCGPSAALVPGACQARACGALAFLAGSGVSRLSGVPPGGRGLSRAAERKPSAHPARGHSWARPADVSEPDLGPGVSFPYQIGRVCTRSKGSGWFTVGRFLDPTREACRSGRQEGQSQPVPLLCVQFPKGKAGQ